MRGAWLRAGGVAFFAAALAVVFFTGVFFFAETLAGFFGLVLMDFGDVVLLGFLPAADAERAFPRAGPDFFPLVEVFFLEFFATAIELPFDRPVSPGRSPAEKAFS